MLCLLFTFIHFNYLIYLTILSITNRKKKIDKRLFQEQKKKLKLKILTTAN